MGCPFKERSEIDAIAFSPYPKTPPRDEGQFIAISMLTAGAARSDRLLFNNVQYQPWVQVQLAALVRAIERLSYRRFVENARLSASSVDLCCEVLNWR
jgi:hypothetical protein